MADDPWADDPHDPDQYGGDAPNPEDGPHADLGTYASDREVQAPNPQKSMGTGVKILVALLIGGGLLALLCCCGGFWEFSASGITSPDATPAGVRAKTDEILTIDIPDDFNPEISLGGEIPVMRWFVDMRMDVAAYAVPGGGQLMLMKLRVPPGQDQAAMEAQLKQSMNQSGNNQNVRVDVTSTETRTLVTADGRSIDWQFSEGTGRGPDGGDLGAFREVKGTFVDGTDVYILNLMIAEDEYDEAEIVSMLESIELVDPQTEPVPPGNEDVMEEAEVESDEIEAVNAGAESGDEPAE
ncbi:hypothetical protein [Alienimonas californiensis]|uniref:Uncharacterized protein n=1 Tax=Alienimonas californiensis TaxID=2527989 RepID=A0A517P6U2_9PLAN|nr:hypothetical protein [Alienimonas californiensis]QDT15100.1 hypothetical protein CA12_11810 [Alienimonas californiensis]